MPQLIILTLAFLCVICLPLFQNCVQCDVCGKFFISSRSLGEHMKTHRKDDPQANPHQCQVCSDRFQYPSGLRRHMDSHRILPKLNCTFPGCRSQFTRKPDLTRHIKIHDTDPVYCIFPKCDYYSSDARRMKAHAKWHKRAEDHHVCEKCGFYCKADSSWARHICD